MSSLCFENRKEINPEELSLINRAFYLAGNLSAMNALA